MEHLYSLKYKFEFEHSNKGFTNKEIEDSECGGTDALFIASIVRDGITSHDGASSVKFFSFDGQNPDVALPRTEIFKVWSMLASNLSEDNNVPEWQKEIAKEAFLKVKKIIMDRREEKK